MEKKIQVVSDYLYLPVAAETDKQLLEIYLEEDKKTEKILEFHIPSGETKTERKTCHYTAGLPVKQWLGKTLLLKGSFPEAFWNGIETRTSPKEEQTHRPSIHFTAKTGWINDPNGLVYKDGIYHLYFQYNPFDTQWDNMSWGHAVSRDLLHWQQKDAVLFPDENGMMYSGSGIVNERSCLGFSEAALLFFYSAAGGTNPWGEEKQFTQRVAVSTDGGDTLQKTEVGILDTICKENRDPKVFWHEESGAYIMVLWLEENDFAIFRSGNLQTWNMTDRFTLDQAWECPDLMKLFDQDGKEHWMFWSADGYYYWGTFNGYAFDTDGIRHEAYLNRIPYAAQTYSGIPDRTISVHWLRIPNQGCCYTGAMGIPRELSAIKLQGEYKLAQTPVLEYRQQRKQMNNSRWLREGKLCCSCGPGEVLELYFVLKDGLYEAVSWNLGGQRLIYHPGTGEFRYGEESFRIGQNIRDFSFLIDENIFEVTADHDTITGAFALEQTEMYYQAEGRFFEEIQLYSLTGRA